MGYQFSPEDPSTEAGIRRIALDQVDSMRDALSPSPAEVDDAVHEVRKSCKKVRALLRLVRPAFEDYAAENAAFRAIGAAVSAARDAQIRVTSYDALMATYHAQVDHRALASVRRQLARMREKQMDTCDPRRLLGQCRGPLEEAAGRVAQWRLQGGGFGVLRAGMAKSYRGARRAMREVERAPTAPRFHEWRKRCKDHYYHAHLLQPIWPGPMKARAKCAHQLTEILGDHHDLTVLLQTLTDRPAPFGSLSAIELLAGLIHQRQALCGKQALSLGRRLLADRPKALAHAWGIRYAAWREEKPARTEALKETGSP